MSTVDSAYTPVTDKGRATRSALLKAAEEVFGEETFDKASVAEITRRAGVAQGTFYVYFPDKKAAFSALVRELNHSLRRWIAARVEGIEDRLDVERAGYVAFFEFVTEHPALYKLVREAEFVDLEAHTWHYATLGAAYARGLRRAGEAGQISDELDYQTVATMLMAVAEAIGGEWVIRRGATPPQETLDQVIGFIERGLGHRRAGE